MDGMPGGGQDMANGSGHRRRILVVEDDETTAELIELVLNGEGNYYAVAALNSQSASNWCAAFNPT